jgi:hypothetical protein
MSEAEAKPGVYRTWPELLFLAGSGLNKAVAHSIRSEVARLFEGRLPDPKIGTAFTFRDDLALAVRLVLRSILEAMPDWAGRTGINSVAKV